MGLRCYNIGRGPRDKWMIMSDMDLLIAHRYKHVMVLLSINKGQLETFFPLRGAPLHRQRTICLTHVNDNHFMMVYLKDGCSIPLTFVLYMETTLSKRSKKMG
jgi:hypothetical protein